uniref:C2 domain-containing protein n=1 Tax=Anopheles epiroticus TaxID=199890 RepID=A0A182PBK6_9DIPT
MELTTFFGLALGFVALILVLFLYVNKIRCFGAAAPFLPFEEHLIAEKTFHRIRNRFAYDGNNSSDSEDDTLRRLKLAPLGGDSTVPSFNKILSKHGHASRDPLAMAEGGKIGMPQSSNDCSSGSSNEVDCPGGVGGTSGGGGGGSGRSTRLSLDAHVSNDRLADLKLKGAERQLLLLLPELTKESEERDLTSRKQTTKVATNGGGEEFGPSLAKGRAVVAGEEGGPTGAAAVVGCEQAPLTQQDSLDDVLSLNNDCILVFANEPLYDTSDLKSLKSDAGGEAPVLPAAGTNGTLEISLLYDAPMRKMTVHVLQARGIASRGDKGQLTHTQVRLLMLPAKRQKHKTKIRSGENPQFMESFLLHRVNPEEVNSMGLRIRVYGCERMRRERLIGETIVSFASIDLELETNLWLPLESRSSSTDTASTSDLLSIARSDSAGSTTSMQHGGVPELLLGLGYNGITGRLTVEIVKGSHFRNHTLPKVPDTYVKMCLVSSMGQEIARAKTSTRRGQSNPLFKETFIFQVALFQLNDVTLIVSVYAKRNMKRNEMVGWFSMGLNSSGPEEMIHWNEMRESSSRSELITRWHVLVDS